MPDRAAAVQIARGHFARWTALLDAADDANHDERQEQAISITVDLIASCGLDPFGPEFDREECDDVRSTIQALVDLLEHVPAGEREVRREVGVLHAGRVEGPMREELGDTISRERHAELRAELTRGVVVHRQVITVTTPWEPDTLSPLAARHAAERAELEQRQRTELAAMEPGRG